MLKDVGSSKHNVMRPVKPAEHNKDGKRPAKRIRLGSPGDDEPAHPSASPQPSLPKGGLIDFDSDADDKSTHIEQDKVTRKTDLEAALPPVDSDKVAIAAYEASKTTELDASIEERLTGRKWVPGKSSIYVDAFNLALETVLEDESHLFDEAENSVFQYWRNLSYEAQYL